MNYKKIYKLFTINFWKRHLPKIKSKKGKFECNLCGNRTNSFLNDGWHENIICPYCYSDVRHRLEFAIFKFIDKYKIDDIFRNKNILHFAAEKPLVKILKKHSKSYICTDIKTGTDITNMPQFDNGTFDVVIANDVLEHINNLNSGIQEIFRVLKDGGYFVCTVPQRDNLEKTEENQNINTPELREKYYGQHDHLRIFGNDFKETLEDSNFIVDVIDKNYFPCEIAEKYILFPQELSTKYNVTNYRKIYICKK